MPGDWQKRRFRRWPSSETLLVRPSRAWLNGLEGMNAKIAAGKMLYRLLSQQGGSPPNYREVNTMLDWLVDATVEEALARLSKEAANDDD